MPTAKTREELLNNESVREQIAERAYYISESHGFAPGRELEFWTAAEQEVLANLLAEKTPKTTATKVAENATADEKPAPKAKAAPSPNGGTKAKATKTKEAPAAEPTAKAATPKAATPKAAPKRTTKKA